jgi:rhodanese-related sulfurtransferase
MSSVYQMTPTQLAANSIHARVIDVREPTEVTGGAIAGSTNIPLDQLPAHLGELDHSVPLVLVCRSGRRSQLAAEALAAAGFTVANLDGGIDRWTAEGHHLV